jgi:hypothetical protein
VISICFVTPFILCPDFSRNCFNKRSPRSSFSYILKLISSNQAFTELKTVRVRDLVFTRLGIRDLTHAKASPDTRPGLHQARHRGLRKELRSVPIRDLVFTRLGIRDLTLRIKQSGYETWSSPGSASET